MSKPKKTKMLNECRTLLWAVYVKSPEKQGNISSCIKFDFVIYNIYVVNREIRVKVFLTGFFLFVMFLQGAHADVAAKTYVDSSVPTKVNLTGNENIAGIKTFTANSVTVTSELPEELTITAPAFISQPNLDSVLGAYLTNTDLATQIANMLSFKMDKIASGTVGNVLSWNDNGGLQDAGVQVSGFMVRSGVQEIGGEKTFTSMPLIQSVDLSGL